MKKKDLGAQGAAAVESDGQAVHARQLSHAVMMASLRELLRVQEAYVATSPMKNRGVSAVRVQALNQAIAILEAREGVHAKFGYVRGENDKCACAYCVGDAEALAEMCAEYEMRNLSLSTTVEELLKKIGSGNQASPTISESPRRSAAQNNLSEGR